MGRAGKTINAAMLAAPIGVDGAVKFEIGGTVARNDAFGFFHNHIGFKGGQIRHTLPAVIHQAARQRLEPPRGIGDRAAPAPSGTIDRAESPLCRLDLTFHRLSFSQNENICRTSPESNRESKPKSPHPAQTVRIWAGITRKKRLETFYVEPDSAFDRR